MGLFIQDQFEVCSAAFSYSIAHPTLIQMGTWATETAGIQCALRTQPSNSSLWSKAVLQSNSSLLHQDIQLRHILHSRSVLDCSTGLADRVSMCFLNRCLHSIFHWCQRLHSDSIALWRSTDHWDKRRRQVDNRGQYIHPDKHNPLFCLHIHHGLVCSY